MQSIMMSLSTHLDHLDWVDTASRAPQVREHGLQPDHSNSANTKRELILVCQTGPVLCKTHRTFLIPSPAPRLSALHWPRERSLHFLNRNYDGLESNFIRVNFMI